MGDTSLQIVVFGSSGGIGREVVAQALSLNYHVKAVYRRSAPKIAPHEHLKIEIVDSLDDVEVIRGLIKGSSAIISALGQRRKNQLNPWSELISPRNLMESFAEKLLTAIKKEEWRGRFIAVSAAGVGESWKKVSPVLKSMIANSNIDISYKDLNRMESLLGASDIDWICVRPTTLTRGAKTGVQKISNCYGFWDKISRADVADFILKQLNEKTLSRTVQITGSV